MWSSSPRLITAHPKTSSLAYTSMTRKWYKLTDCCCLVAGDCLTWHADSYKRLTWHDTLIVASGCGRLTSLHDTVELERGWGVPRVGNQSKRPHSKTATTRTATLSGITTRTATLLWSKRPHCFGQNGHIGWVATKTATLFLVKTATPLWSKRPQGGLYLNEQKWLPKRPHCIWSKRPQIVSDINFVKSE